ncbi:GAF and ANTAR domain-containing protein [Streptomyces sp. NPDC059010]|uniref:GAF and ANTAR domain-containing protein n=1 Tax=Streptomyces sp. NPDC059010 TaxID=3346695 RepID=UPI00367F5B84
MPYESRETDLAASFVELADSLGGDDFDVSAFLHTLTEHCVRLLDVAATGVLLASSQGRVLDMAASDERTHTLQTPCVEHRGDPGQDCLRAGRPIPDIPLDHPHAQAAWPRYSRAAHDLGFTSVAAVPLRLRDQVIGALVLLNTRPAPLDADRLRLARALANMATISIIQQRALRDSAVLTAQLRHGLSSRVIIEQAKGVLAQRRGLSLQEAFEQIRRYARHHRRRLAEVAQEVVDSVPGGSHPPHDRPSDRP